MIFIYDNMNYVPSSLRKSRFNWSNADTEAWV